MFRNITWKHVVVFAGLSTFAWWLLFENSEHAQQAMAAKPIHFLILAMLPLVVILPVTIKRLVALTLFRLYWAVWMIILIPTLLIIFGRVSGLGDRGDPIFYVCGVCAAGIAISGFWRKSLAKE